MNCPIDGTELRVVERQGVDIDYCPRCRGVWLDRGELEKLIEREGMSVRSDEHYEDFEKPKRSQISRDEDEFEFRREPAARPYDRYDDDPYRDDRRGNRRDKKKSFLGEIFDIFD